MKKAWPWLLLVLVLALVVGACVVLYRKFGKEPQKTAQNSSGSGSKSFSDYVSGGFDTIVDVGGDLIGDFLGLG